MPDASGSFLVIKLADLGDVLTATPALRALRHSFPGARVDILTTPQSAGAVPRDLVDDCLVVHRNLVRRPVDLLRLPALLLRLRRRRYSAVVLLHHLTLQAGVAKYRLLAAATGAPVVAGLDNGRGGWLTHAVPDRGFGALHEVEYCLEVVACLGAVPAERSLAVGMDQHDTIVASALLAEAPASGLRVVIHPGSGGYSAARRWEPAKWAQVADSLALRHGAVIILVGTREDGADAVATAMTAPSVNLAGRTTVPQLAAVLAQCDLFLGADSGVMHVAAAVGVPLVAVFGPSNHRAWGPWTPDSPSAIVRLAPACSPCSYVEHRVGRRDGCWHRSCMADLQPAHLMAAVRSLGLIADTAETLDA